MHARGTQRGGGVGAHKAQTGGGGGLAQTSRMGWGWGGLAQGHLALGVLAQGGLDTVSML